MAYPPRALRADRAAAYLSMSTAFFLELVEQGQLPQPKRIGKAFVFWDRADLDAFVEQHESESADHRNELEKALGFDKY
jgi:predicted DNA-binding transcriptional regulator AlpA